MDAAEKLKEAQREFDAAVAKASSRSLASLLNRDGDDDNCRICRDAKPQVWLQFDGQTSTNSGGAFCLSCYRGPVSAFLGQPAFVGDADDGDGKSDDVVLSDEVAKEIVRLGRNDCSAFVVKSVMEATQLDESKLLCSARDLPRHKRSGHHETRDKPLALDEMMLGTCFDLETGAIVTVWVLHYAKGDKPNCFLQASRPLSLTANVRASMKRKAADDNTGGATTKEPRKT